MALNKFQKLLVPKKTVLTPFLKKVDPTTIYLKSKKKSPTIGQQLKKQTQIKNPIIKTITSPKLTGALVGTLSVLTGSGPISALMKGASVPVAAGVLQASPTIDKAVTGKIKDPIGSGRALGSLFEKSVSTVGTGLESIGKGIGKTTEFVASNKKKLAIAGLGAGALAGGGILASKILSREKSTPLGATLPATPTSATVFSTPGAPMQAVEPVTTQPSVNITVKPKIKNYLNNIIQVV